jgi:hypothetical protein
LGALRVTRTAKSAHDDTLCAPPKYPISLPANDHVANCAMHHAHNVHADFFTTRATTNDARRVASAALTRGRDGAVGRRRRGSKKICD